MSNFQIEILNYFDREAIAAEVYYNRVQWAEVTTKDKQLIAQFFANPSRECLEFPYEETIQALVNAKHKLLAALSAKSAFCEKTAPNPAQINKQAETILEEILNHPEKKVVQGEFKRFGKVLDIYAPHLGGARYTVDGEFIGFLEC